MGELIVNKVTLNSIFVTWQIPKNAPENQALNSPSFTLVTDGYPISFALSIADYSLRLVTLEKKGLGRIGRSIVFLAVRSQTVERTIRIYVDEACKQSLSYKNVAIFAMNLTDVKIDCNITWLEFVDDIPSPKHRSPLLSIEDVPFDNTEFSDFTIIAEGQEIPSHKAILARYSPVFLTMFKTPMKESKENRITIEDIEYSTMKILLEIIYTGKTEDLKEINTAVKVFKAAAKYQMSAIKTLCEYKLQQKIRADNVLMLLAEADKHDAPLLCETCVEYIFAAQNEKLTEEFKKMSGMPKINLAIINVLMDQFSLVPSQANK